MDFNITVTALWLPPRRMNCMRDLEIPMMMEDFCAWNRNSRKDRCDDQGFVARRGNVMNGFLRRIAKKQRTSTR